MSRLRDFLKQRKLWVALAFTFLVIIPACLAFTVWLINFDGWDDWDVDGHRVADDDHGEMTMDDHFKDLGGQLKTVTCPARQGLELRDYWNCLWSTSITAEGIEQHNRIMWQVYLDKLEYERLLMNRRHNKTCSIRNKTKKTGKRRRVRRQAQRPPTKDELDYSRKRSFFWDTYYPFILPDNVAPELHKQVRVCQQQILPGIKIQLFLDCIRRIVKVLPPLPTFQQLVPGGLGHSHDIKFLPTTLPPFESDYDKNEYPVLEIRRKDGSNFKFIIQFKPLGDEEKQDNFQGADPYFDENWSVYRYKYNHGITKQRQVGWSYHGQDSPQDWHSMDLERFLVPLAKDANLKGATFVSELAQSYPGIGELAVSVDELNTPLDFRWTKDSGYNVYTRYMVPLLSRDDLIYYKSKGLIGPEVKKEPDAKQIDAILNFLIDYYYGAETQISETYFNAQLGKLDEDVPPQFAKEEDIPYVKIYYEFLSHFFGIDISRYRIQKKQDLDDLARDRITRELELARQIINTYVAAVHSQESCLREMIEEQDGHRLEDEDELKELIEKVKADDPDVTGCRPALNHTLAIDQNDGLYYMNQENLRFLYDRYFDRKEARQRYSLPKYPVEFPICRHNEPSPIDIQTDRGRKSSIRDYSFGPAAYRLNRFFMFYPIDGSSLLTVGIVDGERLDGSSVRLTGGAVRGQNLTFQYMHIRFGSSWKNPSGSEHMIDGKGAPMELQMVFTIAGSADSIKYWHILARVHNQLFQFRGKLVIILSVLVDVLEDETAVVNKIKEDNLNQDPYVFEPFAQAAYHFRRIPEKYPKYEQPRGYVSLDPTFRFIDFIPKKSSKFYTYRGSLSWPPCFGYVLWSVYEQRLYMSKRQFDQFIEIKSIGTEASSFNFDNFRPVDPIWVEEEHEPNLLYNQVEDMKRRRTIDRHVLVGLHQVDNEGDQLDQTGVVGEEVYYISSDNSGSSRVMNGSIRIFNLILLILSLGRMYFGIV